MRVRAGARRPVTARRPRSPGTPRAPAPRRDCFRSQRRDGAGLDFGRDLIAHPLEGSRDGDRNLDLAKAVAAGLRQDGGEKCLVG